MHSQHNQPITINHMHSQHNQPITSKLFSQYTQNASNQSTSDSQALKKEKEKTIEREEKRRRSDVGRYAGGGRAVETTRARTVEEREHRPEGGRAGTGSAGAGSSRDVGVGVGASDVREDDLVPNSDNNPPSERQREPAPSARGPNDVGGPRTRAAPSFLINDARAGIKRKRDASGKTHTYMVENIDDDDDDDEVEGGDGKLPSGNRVINLDLLDKFMVHAVGRVPRARTWCARLMSRDKGCARQ